MNSISDYIMVVENAMTNALCDAILEEYGPANDWVDTSTKGGIRKDIRSCQCVYMSHQNVIQINKKVRQKLDRYVFASAGYAFKKYNEKFKYAEITQDSGYEILRYNPGEFYTEHVDHFTEAPRSVSCSFALNDNYEGGEWSFFGGKKVIKVPKGAVIMFPSNFMYPHEIMPVTKGVRYSVITWFI
jgi:predicted 2-oxoglutarate/Fe(II)-dependent dioxygenase YbiX